jgi:hypothetical protein
MRDLQIYVLSYGYVLSLCKELSKTNLELDSSINVTKEET